MDRDIIIDELLGQKPLICADKFADETVARIKAEAELDARLDEKIDILLKASAPITLGTDFDDRVCGLAKKKRPNVAAMIAYTATAACAMFAAGTVFWQRTPTTDFDKSYEQMTQVAQEISDLSLFIIQEDFLAGM